MSVNLPAFASKPPPSATIAAGSAGPAGPAPKAVPATAAPSTATAAGPQRVLVSKKRTYVDAKGYLRTGALHGQRARTGHTLAADGLSTEDPSWRCARGTATETEVIKEWEEVPAAGAPGNDAATPAPAPAPVPAPALPKPAAAPPTAAGAAKGDAAGKKQATMMSFFRKA